MSARRRRISDLTADPWEGDPGDFADDGHIGELPEPIPTVSEREWIGYKLGQVDSALGLLAERPSIPDVAGRAAVILMADPWAPELERVFGGRTASFEGQMCKCRTCKRKYVEVPEDPYLNATTRADGVCSPCFLLAESQHPDQVPVLTGKIVKPKAIEQ